MFNRSKTLPLEFKIEVPSIKVLGAMKGSTKTVKGAVMGVLEILIVVKVFVFVHQNHERQPHYSIIKTNVIKCGNHCPKLHSYKIYQQIFEQKFLSSNPYRFTCLHLGPLPGLNLP